jgi:hypothetical protein
MESMTKENHPKRELSRREIQEIELFRAILQDERDDFERLKDNEPQDPDK